MWTSLTPEPYTLVHIMEDDTLFFLDPGQGQRKRAVVPSHLREQILDEGHRAVLGGHFSGKRTYSVLVRHWWWEGRHADTLRFVRNCPECAVVTGGGRPGRPPLHPIPVQRPFQIMGVDVMDLPVTKRGNRHVLVFQDFLTKWPLVFPLPDQKAIRIAKVLVEDVIPLFGVPEALLSDRGTNLLSHLMKDLCQLLGVKKLNTTAYHPQCDGMVERFNRTLKSAIRKHAARFGPQWDQYLPGILWAYRNTPHESTKEKPSFLLFGVDLRSPTEATLLPTAPLEPGSVEDYRQETVLSLSSARELAADAIREAQKKYKRLYDRKASVVDFRVGDWVMVRFPQEESGKNRKLSRPWHGPYRVISRDDPDVTVVRVYAPQYGPIQVHQTRVTPCPPQLPAGFFWYGTRRHSPGRPPRWLLNLDKDPGSPDRHPQTTIETETSGVVEPCGEDSDSSDEEGDPAAVSKPKQSALSNGFEESDEEGRDGDVPVDVCPSAIRTKAGSGRYCLRQRVTAPDRLEVRSGRAS